MSRRKQITCNREEIHDLEGFTVLTFYTFIIKTIPIFLIEYYFVLVDITQKMSFMFLKDLQNPYYDHRLKEPCGS